MDLPVNEENLQRILDKLSEDEVRIAVTLIFDYIIFMSGINLYDTSL